MIPISNIELNFPERFELFEPPCPNAMVMPGRKVEEKFTNFIFHW